MKQATRTVAAVLLLAAVAQAVQSLTVAYNRIDHAAPLFDACLYPKDFRPRYGLYLKEVKPQAEYSLLDGKRNVLSLKLASFDTDSAVLSALLSGSAQVGMLASEAVLATVLQGRPVKIIAPLQYRGDLLVVDSSAPAADGKEFIAWVKSQRRPISVGYIGMYSMAALGFMQALQRESVNCAATLPGRDLLPKSEPVKVRLFRVDDAVALAAGLSSRRLDAAVVQEPTATWVSMLQDCRTVGRIDVLPPGRFEDRPGTIIAATDSAIRSRGKDLGRFLELMAVATHYANDRTGNTLEAVNRWLGTAPALESIALRNVGFSSSPDANFTSGIWNWYSALRLRNALPRSMAGYRAQKAWLGVPYDSSLLMPALERAGARINR